jgi:hypothetical protein
VVKDFVSFVTQRFDRIQGGSFARGIKSEEDANGCTEQKCDSN